MVRRSELDITIDYRLGTSFPSDRRAALWDLQKGMDTRPLLLALLQWLKQLAKGKPANISNVQARYLVNQYSRVLDMDELCQFFDLDVDAVKSLLR